MCFLGLKAFDNLLANHQQSKIRRWHNSSHISSIFECVCGKHEAEAALS